MSDEEEEKPKVIIIKRVTKKSGHHGGGWKIAYADFMTAMMAFFMLMWMLSLLNKSQLQGVSNYFKKPMKDLFIDNERHNTNIPKIAAEQTEKSDFAPVSTTKVGRSLIKAKGKPTSRSEPDIAKTDSEGKAIEQAQHDTTTPITEVPRQDPQKATGKDSSQTKPAQIQDAAAKAMRSFVSIK